MAARKDPYEELLGYWFCSKCLKRPGKWFEKCCKVESSFQGGTFIAYFHGTEHTPFVDGLIHYESAFGPVKRTPLEHTPKNETTPTLLEIIHRPELDFEVLKSWLAEYVHYRK
jgi:hypothetical protein